MKINKRNVIREIQKNKEEIKEKSVKRIGVFGSVIKGKKNPRDIDILIEFKNPTFDNYSDILILLERIFKKKVDLITKSSLRPELKYLIKEAEYVGL